MRSQINSNSNKISFFKNTETPKVVEVIKKIDFENQIVLKIPVFPIENPERKKAITIALTDGSQLSNEALSKIIDLDIKRITEKEGINLKVWRLRQLKYMISKVFEKYGPIFKNIEDADSQMLETMYKGLDMAMNLVSAQNHDKRIIVLGKRSEIKNIKKLN